MKWSLSTFEHQHLSYIFSAKYTQSTRWYCKYTHTPECTISLRKKSPRCIMLHCYKLSFITLTHFSGCSYPPLKRSPICPKSWDEQGAVFSHQPWLGEWCEKKKKKEGVRIRVVGDITPGFVSSCTAGTQPPGGVGEGWRGEEGGEGGFSALSAGQHPAL